MIILTILGIIGKILLVILGIVLFLILTVLFYPILYSISGESDKGKLCFEGSVSWLYNLVGIKIKYDNGYIVKDLRILFFHKNLDGDSAKNKVEDDENVAESEETEQEERKLEESKEPEQIESEAKENLKEPEQVESKAKEESEQIERKNVQESTEPKQEECVNGEELKEPEQEKVNLEEESDTEECEIQENASGDKDSGAENNTASRFDKLKRGFINKLNRKRGTSDNKAKKSKKDKNKDSKLKSTLSKINQFKDDPQMMSAVSHLKREFVHLLKAILPDKMKVDMQFSLGEPDYTGIILGILAVFPAGYKNRWKLIPDFESEKAYVIGKWRISGRFSVISFLLIFVRIILDKNCRKLYNKYIK